MSLPALAAGILGGLPKPLDWVALIVITVLLAAMVRVLADIAFVAGPRWLYRRLLERKAVRVLLRKRRDRGEENRQDVQDRADDRTFKSWDADAEMGKLLAFERQTDAEILEFPKQIGGWQR